MRALVMGYFSTVGDIEVLWQVERQLRAAGVAYDVGAFDPNVSLHLPGAVELSRADPRTYSHVLVVCGPFNREHFKDIGLDLDRFAHCTRIGVNLTMLEDLEVYNPLDALLGRDSNAWTVPDLSFRESVSTRPVVGLCLARNQPEYGTRVKHAEANAHLRRLVERADLVAIELDTEWPAAHNAVGIRSPEEFESLCGRIDVMLTTRLHGMTLALKNGVPVLAMDAISGGGKVTRQARAIGWNELLQIDEVSDAALDAAIARCLEPTARDRALACAARARAVLEEFPAQLTHALEAPPRGLPSRTGRPVVRRLLRAVNLRRRARDMLRRRRARRVQEQLGAAASGAEANEPVRPAPAS